MEVLEIKDVAKLMRVNVRTVQKWVKEPEKYPIGKAMKKLGRNFYITVDRLEEVING